MMAGMCPMQVPGTTVAAVDVEGGIGLSFTTTTGDVGEPAPVNPGDADHDVHHPGK
jgi:hypothetical protein